MIGADEGSQGAHSRSEAVKFVNRQAILVISSPKIGKFLIELFNYLLIYRVLEALFDFDIRIIKLHCPGIGNGQDNITADQFGPVQVMPVGGCQQACPVATRFVNRRGLLDGGNAGPMDNTWV